jgi:hypothetical protein
VHCYSVYALAVASEVELPELVAAPESPPDVTIRFGPVELGEPPDAEVQSWLEIGRDPLRTASVFEAVGRFEVQAGSLIVVDPLPGADERLVRHALLGPVLAQLLWQRELFTLHASVVRVGTRHAAFVGVSGEGKSTTAAALGAHGHALVCDDVAALCWQEEPIRALPGFPRMRLYADTLHSVGADPEALPLVHGLIDKRLKPAASFVDRPVVLDRIYVLETAPELRAEPLPARDALLQLMKHAYNASQFAPTVGLERHLRMAARIARAVPVFRLLRPKDLKLLPNLVGLVESHLQT